ncbi:SDR family NAD(P)-dependent oxidoreductase [Myxococcus qinghaiensis]|uniref:SDR family NAD(P)-dependent oxidoreductase n=1 Tax=Myxococcus qinghaiensis TaxID=2906758 RepID=UPI0020A73483|nr:SDR family NAD(P)-dependent oxidoreductase [Myxococcus qinghaiensis]MCP3162332.1 SDR family NAD(P)-dependent oxidoreductase [Myxococcus qinghaiensis]
MTGHTEVSEARRREEGVPRASEAGEQVALVTGANAGIGLALTRNLLSTGWQVIAVNRSAFPEEDALLKDAVGTGRLRVYTADLTDFDALRAVLGELKGREARIDVLFNNAGGSFPTLAFSKQGREVHYELQTVAPYVLLMELRELLHRGALKTVINTSSAVFLRTKTFDPGALERPSNFRMLLGPYSTTKLALSLWTRELAPQLAAEGIRLLSVDPGGNNTQRAGRPSGLPFWLRPIVTLFFPPPTKGASLLYDAALGNARREPPGAYLVQGKATELGFQTQGRAVLDQVRAIHAREFPARSPRA